MIVILEYEKETKNTIRFKEVNIHGDKKDEPTIGSLYINKKHIQKGVKRITVTVNVES